MIIQGNDGDFHTDGCLKQTCKNSVWRPSFDETVCCYEGEAFTPNTTITATTTGCIMTSIQCREDGNNAKMVLQVENTCQRLLEGKQMNELEDKLDTIEDELDTVGHKLDRIEVNVDAFEEKLEVVEEKLDGLKQLFTQNLVDEVKLSNQTENLPKTGN